MARRVLADFDSEVLQQIGNRTDITAVQRGIFIQDAYQRVARRYEHPELQGDDTETLDSGDDVLTLVTITDLWWPVQLRNDSNGFVITVEDKSQIDSYDKGPGQPSRFYWWKSRFTFDCLAESDIDISIKYKMRPVALETTSVMDEVYDRYIVLCAARIGLETIRDWEGAGFLSNLYSKWEREDGLVPVQEEHKNDFRTGIKVRF